MGRASASYNCLLSPFALTLIFTLILLPLLPPVAFSHLLPSCAVRCPWLNGCRSASAIHSLATTCRERPLVKRYVVNRFASRLMFSTISLNPHTHSLTHLSIHPITIHASIQGDFVTSPELVSIFGELIGVWCVSTWVKLGRPPKIQLIELGPGRGTLMKDILSAAERFPDFRKAISVHMVENSGRMRELQRETLCVTMNDNTAANMSKLKADGEINVDFAKDPTKVMVQQYVDGVSNITFPSDKPSGGEGEAVNPHAAPADLFAKDVEKNAPPPPLSVHWHWTIKDVPVGVPCIIVGNEFLDALPVHQFQFTERGWREILIDIDNGPGPHHFKYVLAPEPTPASRSFVSPVNPLEGLVSPVKPSTPGASSSSSSSPSSTGSKILTSDTVAPLHGTASSPISGGRIAPIPSLVVMEDGKPREVKLEHVKPAPTPLEQAAAGLGPQIGDTYEVSPACFVWTEQIALRIMKTGGAALLIDYGDNDAGFEFAEPNSPSSPAAGASLPAFSDKVKRPLSVMGLKKHGHADVLSEPGLVDLSAHVNFGALRAVARRVSNQISLLLQQPPGSKDHRRALEVMNIIAKRSPSTPAGVEVKPRAFHKIDVYPAITQSQLLQQLGIEARYERLMRNVKSEADAKALHAAVNRLVDPSQMGTLFKAMALVQGGMAPPAGWSKAEGEQQE